MTYLPPSDRDDLIKETARLIGACITGIVLLGIVVYFCTV
ncbi:DUF7156 family protein [Mycobacterium branderi]|uniref:Uncharacterized protein n=1 Tax=Mycobacterium branderi TaxID=43348 RepID=A0ABM7KUQ2_9MYCO|nr:hypothetical protein MBRA_50600 [Mycobacterium branderi]